MNDIDRSAAIPHALGFTPRMLELAGATEVPLSNIEPDPTTFRSNYYYNTVCNKLYLKVQSGHTKAWKDVSRVK